MSTFVIVAAFGFAITWLAYLWLVRPLREAQERTLELAARERETRVRPQASSVGLIVSKNSRTLGSPWTGHSTIR